MNTQFKKGVLELIVLLCVYKKDMYGYELVSEVSKVINVNEGTIYPLLKRLTNEHYFETYLSESTEGPPRKYYRITGNGKMRTKELLQEWNEFHEQVSRFIKEGERMIKQNIISSTSTPLVTYILYPIYRIVNPFFKKIKMAISVSAFCYSLL